MFILTLHSLSVYHISQKYKNIAKFKKRLYLKLIIGYQLAKGQPNQGENVIAQIKVATKPINQTNGKGKKCLVINLRGSDLVLHTYSMYQKHT